MAERTMAGPQQFTARVYRVGINCCVDVPPEVSAALGGDTYIPVSGTAGGQPLSTRMVPRGGGRHRLFLNGDLRRAAGIGEGDSVTVVLALDNEREEPPVPDDLAAALAAVEGAGEAFAGLTAATRASMLAWLAAARWEATRTERIERIVTEMHDRSWR